ncbi:telomere length regulation protein TEL2 [Tripterygium wilfordii]|uniref:Telomere length regulation protein TEL2 n=1 Tax=Tripterygium wilfordii TaxID=458696 RepID=A0A7J7CDF4_TRIWF|nr:telomere length regulation protein TEL2 homolog [Tripterygium wilfordii]KAF5732191.1 telomere length regulation protein TEL2 [Tripterygium wilfordii]
MAMEKRRGLEAVVLDKVGEAVSTIRTAKQVDQVICSLHSLAALLFPIDSSLLSGSIDERYREQVLGAKIPSARERSDWWEVFYRGAAFPTLARVLLLDVASNWLPCFPFSAQKLVYDVYFVDGLTSEVVQTLVPFLQHSGSDYVDVNAVHSNTERLLVLCLLENDGVLKIAKEFDHFCPYEDFTTNATLRTSLSRVAQIVASIPDKARLKAPVSLSSHTFFKLIIIQLLSGMEKLNTDHTTSNKCDVEQTLLFIGEIISRIFRRGSSDVLLSEVIPRVLGHVQSILSSATDSVESTFESKPGSQIWMKIMEVIKDPYVVERMTEQLLLQLAIKCASNTEAYWILWILFHRTIKNQASVRSMFIDKFLLWKVFPLCCLRWILQFAVLQCPPVADSLTKGHESHGLLDTVQRVVAVWSKREFFQSSPMEKQIYLTAAAGLCLEKMSKEELEKTKDVMHSVLQGVSCRLENPDHLVRKMASSIAFVFSKIIDPKNPLYLDDDFTRENIDWEFGLTGPEKGTLSASNYTETNADELRTSVPSVKEKDPTNDRIRLNLKGKGKKASEYKIVDPNEIIDPAILNYESISEEEEDDNASEISDSSSDSSLQPYDLSDDDSDLKRKFSQLVDVVGALRKSDDADGVERALDVAEKLVRASPDELAHVAGDLVRTLIQVRCSDAAVEGEEDSAEEKRQRALVALVVTCPLKSLDNLNKLLYSPNVDISQRIMILDVMSEAAQELADAKVKTKHKKGALISTISEAQPWFLPSSTGPPEAGSWKEISDAGMLLNWSNRYERELPPKPGMIKKGKTRRWSLKSVNIEANQMEWSHNKFPAYAAAFMLPAMQGFDKRRHGVDLLGRDFIVLGKLIYMLGVCMRCASMHPEASALAPPLLDMLKSREICHHKEAYVRRAVLFAASCILVSLHPSYVASALVEGNHEVSEGLEWIRTWALHVADSDIDRECYMMAMSCLQLHTEMALQASRALESTETSFNAKSSGRPSTMSNATIKIPRSSMEFLNY